MRPPNDSDRLVHRFHLYNVFGGILVTRHLGHQIAGAVIEVLKSLQDGSCLIIDCSEVVIMDYSCSDESVGRLLAEVISGEYGERYLALTGPCESVLENIESSLRLRGLPMVAVDSSGSFSVVGAIRPHLAEVLQCFANTGKIRARDIAEALHIALNTASNRLIELHRLGIVSRAEETVTGGGKQFLYRMASIAG